MFSNIFYDALRSRIHLWEYIKGKRQHTVHDIKHEYYVPDETKQSPIQDIYGRSMMLQEADRKKVITELKQSGVYTCEGDLSEDVKFLHKRYKDNIEPEGDIFNIAFLDIEVESPKEFPKPSEVKYPINLLTVKFSKTGESYTFGLKEYTGTLIKNYCWCASEEILLENFIALFRKKKPDILTGWNVNYVYQMTDGFDIPYLLNRCKKLNVDYTLLSPINIVDEKRNGGWFIAGISILDYLSLYKNFEQENRESYSLNYISNVELGEGKLQFEGTINTLWQTDWNTFVEYNVQDVNLVDKLENKLHYLALAYQFAYDALVPFEKVYSSIALLQGHILKELHSQNKVLPDKMDNEHVDFPGAYVYAKTGAYSNVMSFDVESLYPHAIMAWNISPETLVLPNETERIEELRKSGHLITSPVGREEGFIYEDAKVKFDNIYYDGSKQGILAKVVKKIFDERKKYKTLAKECKVRGDKKGAELNNRLQYTRKILANSLYGVIATPHFCLYNVKNAMAITLGGQDLIQFLSSTGNQYLMNVGYRKYKIKKEPLILVDTDSSYYCLTELFEATKKENETFLEWAKLIETELFNPLWKKLIKIHAEKYNSFPVINFVRDLITRKFIILVKKKYAFEVLDKEGYTYPEPIIDYKGIEIVRKDTPSFCRERILDVIKLIFNKNDRTETLELLKVIQKDFKKELPANIAIPKGISDYAKWAKSDEYYEKNGLSYIPKTPIHVRAAINYNYINKKYKLGGLPIYNGTKMKYIHVISNNEMHQDCIGFIGNYPESFQAKFRVDYDRQWKRAFQDIIERFFVVLGWGEVNISSLKLNKFMEF